MIKFYKDTNGKWIIGPHSIPAGFSRSTDNPDGTITIKCLLDPSIEFSHVNKTDFANSAGVPYADAAAYDAATSGFFIRASLPGVDSSAAGYVDMGAMRIQWGSGGAGTTTPLITFPAPFKDTNYTFTGTIKGGGATNVYGIDIASTPAKTAQSLTLYKTFANGSGVGGANGESVEWMAIGLKP